MIGEQYNKPENLISRELSWLEFNQRVLDEATDPKNPLLERGKFLSITTSNLDEFFMVRVGSLKDHIHSEINKPDPAGLTPKQQMKRVAVRAHTMIEDQYAIYNDSFLPKLKEEGIEILSAEDLTDVEKEKTARYFAEEVFPVLTPMAVDPGRPFPLILNRSLNLGLMIEKAEDQELIFATVQVPSVLPRIFPLSDDKRRMILLEDVIRLHVGSLFPNQKILCVTCYRITRNADMEFKEEDAPDLLEEMAKSVKQRKWGQAVRLEISDPTDEKILEYLKEALEVENKDIYYIPGPLDLGFVSKLSKIPNTDHLQFAPLVPQTPQDLFGEKDIFEAIRKNDILMQHPYESFDPVVRFVAKAAEDPDVLAIKQTLYRVSGQSPIIRALAKAADNGKQVTVLVEVKARFDEENNIHWARRLEQAGCHVIYGLVGLKTHCKITLVVRREDEGIRRYVHMGTGNYNDVTARLYTDMGLFTCKEAFGMDASYLFNSLSGYGDPPEYYKVATAPLGLRSRFLSLIEREKQHALNGEEAHIIAKVNSLLDTEIICALYEASQAGVRIDLIVRGICCIRPQKKGVSENIHVRSIVGWLLEHSRVYYFLNGGNEEIFLSSADWMPRNLDRRVELMFPIEDTDDKERLKDILHILLSDNQKARVMDQDGNYTRIREPEMPSVNAQETFYQQAVEAARQYEASLKSEVFRPMRSPEETPRFEEEEQ